MNAKLDKALDRLKLIPPLKERQEACGAQLRKLHQQVLRSFVDGGRIFSREEMAQRVSNSSDYVPVELYFFVRHTTVPL